MPVPGEDDPGLARAAEAGEEVLIAQIADVLDHQLVAPRTGLLRRPIDQAAVEGALEPVGAVAEEP